MQSEPFLDAQVSEATEQDDSESVGVPLISLIELFFRSNGWTVAAIAEELSSRGVLPVTIAVCGPLFRVADIPNEILNQDECGVEF